MGHALVTGGAGFIGSHLTEALLRQGHLVTVIDDESTGSFSHLSNAQPAGNLTLVRGTCADPRLLGDVLPQVDTVYHLAAAVGVELIAKNPILTIENNVYPTEYLLAELRKLWAAGRTVKIFLASTSEVYGKNPKASWNEEDDLVFGPTTCPRWSYGASKAIDEFLALASCRQFGLPVVVGRFFNVVGPRQTGRYGMVLPRFVDAALKGGPLVVHGDGSQIRCFADVQEIVSCVIDLMQQPAAVGQVCNIGSDRPICILDLAKMVASRFTPQPAIAFQSYKEAYSADFEDVMCRVPRLDRLKNCLGRVPSKSLAAIIDEVIADRRKNL